jgi:ribosomal-protein-serine acetyltransferase
MSRIELRHVTIADLRAILGELGEFWGERDMAFLHQALYVHEFGETSVLAEREGKIDGYLLGFVGQHGLGYIHAVAVRRTARGDGLARAMYERFEAHVGARGATVLKAITDPGNAGSRAFHEELGFHTEEVEGYSPSGGTRLVFSRSLGHPEEGIGRVRTTLAPGVLMRPLIRADTAALHALIEANREHLRPWLPFADQAPESTAAYVDRAVSAATAGQGLSMAIESDGELAGAVSFVDLSREHRSTSIGYWLSARVQGRGIMSRAVAAMVEEAFGPWRLERVEIRAAAENARSRAIPERLGFRQEGQLRRAQHVDGVAQDDVVYGLLAIDR